MLRLECPAIGMLSILLAAATLTSCSPQGAAIEACEAYVQERLKAPSTYKQISADAFIEVDGDQGWVTVEYDAANSFGTPMREKQICTFDTPGRKWPARAELMHQAELASIGDEGSCCNDAKHELEEGDETSENALPNDVEPTPPAPAPAPAARKAVSLCWQDYCPCDAPQGGPDAGLCRQLRAGMDVDPHIMSAAAMMRDARQQMEEFEAEHGEW